jgi:tetratricopeptide (TPR) repeat protein
MVNAGQDALTAKDNATARKFWTLFVESDAAPMFKDQNRDQQKPFFGQVARFAAIFAYQDKDMAKALELADVAMKDPQEYENALNLKLEILGDGLKTKDDSLKYVENLKSLYAEHKTNGVMEKLYNTLIGVGQAAEADKIIDDALAADPNNFVALADKGLSLLQAQKAEEAVKYLKRAYDVKNDNAIIATYAGTAYVVQAQNVEDPAKKKELYKQAIEMFDKAKELDPDMLQAKWGYNRYNAYYNYYGENAPETKQAEQDSH